MHWLLNAEIHTLGTTILWREIIGNLFGLGSAVLGMYRRVWAWPLGMIGNALLFTVFLGGVFATPQDQNLYGQAGRQLFFFAISAYGWWRWRYNRGRNQAAVQPRWATGRERVELAVLAVVGIIVGYFVLKALDSYGPLADAWILTGSLLATYGMAKGFVEFWLIWIAVDLVGVPLLLNAGYYPSAILYVVYGGFCLWGFFTWMAVKRSASTQPTDPVLEAVG